jgi:hypothetical protein
MSFQLYIPPEAQAYAPPPALMQKLKSYFNFPHMRAHILPRRLANETLGKDKGHYAYRGFTRGNDSYMFVDPTETPESIAWLTAHELAHQKVDTSPTLQAAFRDATVYESCVAGDAFHRYDPEERFCDGIATNLVGKRLDRDWWRKRTMNPRLTGGRPYRDARTQDRRTVDRRR